MWHSLHSVSGKRATCRVREGETGHGNQMVDGEKRDGARICRKDHGDDESLAGMLDLLPFYQN